MLRKSAFSQTSRTALCGLLVFACGFSFLDSQASGAEKVASKTTPPNQKIANDLKFHRRLLEIATKYPGYGKVDDMRRWAPAMCAMAAPPKARVSRSKDPSTHGRKLYFLFAKNRNSYVNNEKDTAGQVIVKEAWLEPSYDAHKSAAEDKNSSDVKPAQSFAAFEKDSLGPKSGLFIMYNTGSKAPDTDDGWVYGTVMPDGKIVTSAGRVQTCMGCHVSAPHGRLFGLQQQ